VQRLARAGDVAALHHFDEIPQLPQVHVGRSLLLPITKSDRAREISYFSIIERVLILKPQKTEACPA
jgi:hypothetical protein